MSRKELFKREPAWKRPMVVDTEGTPLKLKAEKGPKQRSQERCKARRS